MKLKGILLSEINGPSFIRQYTGNGEFRDISIWHHDLNVEIDDDSAVIRVDKDGNEYIDYTDEVLGAFVDDPKKE